MNKSLIPLSVAAILVAASPAYAEEREDLETLRQTTLNLIQALVQTGILTQDKANTLLSEAKRSAAEKVAADKQGTKVVRVPYVPQTVRDEIKDQLRQEVMTQAKAEGWAAPAQVPKWLDGLKMETELRVRYQQDRFASGNFTPLELSVVEDPINIGNTQDNNSRWRTRLRFGVEAKFGEMTTAGFRLATGSLTDPLSTNQTLGNSFDRFAVGVERAYIRLQPTDWLTLDAGRIANPFLATDLVWHPDLNFDGVAGRFQQRFSDAHSAYLTLGAFPLQKIDPNSAPGTATSAKDKWLYGAQAGYEWQGVQTSLKAAVALYDYSHVEGIANPADPLAVSPGPFDQTAPQFRQKGNSLFQVNVPQVGANGSGSIFGLASKFRELDLTGTIDFAQLDPVHVLLTGDVVKNIGFDRNEILQRTGRDIAPRTLGYQAKLTVGQPHITRRGEWQVFGAYKYLQRDAVLDAFTDSDFRLGGTDAKGYILGGSYGIDKNTWLSFKWLSADPIDGPPFSVDVMQIDLNSRF